MIEKLRVRNFRCLRDVEVPLGPLNFLIGPNNTGKSSFLDAMDILCQLAGGTDANSVFQQRTPPAEGNDRRGHGLRRNLTNGDAQSRLEYECAASWDSPGGEHHEGLYLLGLAFAEKDPHDSRGGARVVSESLEIRDGQGVALSCQRAGEVFSIAGRNVPRKESDFGDRRHSIVGVRRSDPLFAPLSDLLRTSPVYRLVPERIAMPCNTWPGDAVLADGFGLASYLARVADETPDLIQGIEGTLARLVPGLQKVTFPNVSQNQKTILFHEKGGSRVYASEASDGLLLFLAYLTIAYAHENVSVLLIEEPETGVNPHRLRAIVELLRAISRGSLGSPPVQVVATSHSPYLLDWCSKEEILLFQRDPEGGVHVTPFSQVKDVDEQLKDFTPGELIFTFGENICGSRS